MSALALSLEPTSSFTPAARDSGRHLAIRACEAGAKVQSFRVVEESSAALLLEHNGALVPMLKIGDRHLESSSGRLYEILLAIVDGAL